MSEKMTRIIIINDNGSYGPGIKEWGEITAEEGIKRLREHYQYQLEQAQKMLSKKDSEFQVDVVRGVHAENHIKTLQNALPTPAAGEL